MTLKFPVKSSCSTMTKTNLISCVDALNPNPCSLFSVQQFSNEFLLFPNLSYFLPESASSEPKPLPERIQSKKQGDLFAHTKRKLRSPSPPSEPKRGKKSSKDIKACLLPVLSDVLESVAGVPKPVQFLDSAGNWPLCRTKKCKELGRYAAYSEQAGKKPVYCSSCRPNVLAFHILLAYIQLA